MSPSAFHPPHLGRRQVLAAGAAAGLLLAAGRAAASETIDHVEVLPGLQLRRLVVKPANPRGTVLLLQGFPETLALWAPLARELGRDHEVHVFDWPGYGQSSRPDAEDFGYAPRDYAQVLHAYIRKAGLDPQHLLIHATDIGALPALLMALDEPALARRLIVGDFAPFDRPSLMYASLQALKTASSAAQVRKHMNAGAAEILQNTWNRGLPPELHVQLPIEVQQDLRDGWYHGAMTSADAFACYYQHFTRDQQEFESRIAGLRTPLDVVWGERDLYIHPDMGAELARRTGAPLHLLGGVGHYPHLQRPDETVALIRRLMPQS